MLKRKTESVQQV